MARPKKDKPLAWSFEFLDVVLGRVATLPLETLASFGLEDASRALETAFGLEAQAEKVRGELLSELHARVPKETDRERRHELLRLKRALSCGWPNVPADRLGQDGRARDLARRFTELARGREKALLEGARTYEEGCRGLHEKLLALLGDGFFRETIRLSSAELLKAVERYERAPSGPEASRDLRGVRRAVMQHLARCCAKTSPRATLTAVHLGRADASAPGSARIARGEGRHVRRKRVLLSMVVVRQIARAIGASGRAWRRVVPRANPTLYLDKNAGLFKFWRRESGKEQHYHIPAVPLLERLIKEVGPRKLNAAELLARLQALFPRHSPRLLEDYYRKLGDMDLIRAAPEIPFGEIDGLGYLLRWLEDLPPRVRPRPLVRELSKLQRLLRALESCALSDRELARVQQRAARIVNRFTPAPLTPAQFLILDAVSVWKDLRLGSDVLEGLRAALQALAALARDRESRGCDWTLRSLRRRFPGKREISALALHEPNRRAARPVKPSRAIRRLTQLIERRMREKPGTGEVALTLDELGALAGGAKDAGGMTSGCLYVHLARLPGTQHFQAIVDRVDFGPIARGISRWAHLWDEGAGRALERCLRKYHAKLSARALGRNRASVLYLAGQKTDTAGWHPSYHPYEIEAAGAPSAVPARRRFRLEELTLEFGERLAAYARRGGRKIELSPIYEGMQSVGHSPMIQALASAGGGRLRALGWPSRRALAGEGPLPRRLPRLTLGSVVLSRRTWGFEAQALRRRFDALSGWALFAEFDRWRREQELPRFVFVHEGRGQLMARPSVLDACNPYLLDAFAVSLRALPLKAEVWISEMLPAPDGCWTSDEKGRYAHELVVGFIGDRVGD